MTNRLELNWKLDGFIDEQRYYCSETPINTNNLPLPKFILDSSARSYIDSDIELGKTYYIRLGAVKNSIEKLSNEIIVLASNTFRFYRIYITKNSGNLDNYSEMQEVEFAENEGGADITTPQTQTDQSSYFASRTAAKLVDNDLTGGEAIWTSGNQTFPQWVSFDLDLQRDIVEVRIYPAYLNNYYLRAPTEFIVQASNDQVLWHDIRSFETSNWQAGIAKKFNLKTGEIS